MPNYRVEKIEIEGNEYEVFIGKNAIGNDEILRLCDENSIWFHFEDIPSPHVILDIKDEYFSNEFVTLKKYKPYILMIARFLYQYKKNVPKNQKIIYSRLKYIKRTKELGTVLTDLENLYIL